MWAAQTGNLKAVRQLLDLNVDINQQSKSGSHALLLAATEGHTDIVVLLLANEASIDLKNALGDTALIAAVKADNYATAKLLVTSGASTRARNAMFVSARELLQSKDEQWQKLIDEKSSFWSLIN
jgi:ankyrin repeat protein